ncbi:acyl-CoA-binding domain-containing protein 4 isoform X1 [Tachysurus fulvidraco]|uniref:acyl-CoA-binding domain-containing protein 4 isoform X1 n=1 Tax=Tachysurus fulvidraco TaxID=1234273 RepID=UPI001FF02250|nr:acyl-CoA-binding domain-containing protein 4 isoform X1 [Tachysurus fulvidraco]XP_027033573.2 acyl-CoA-binding domain-containing protein 4 isoform X1 [Tachysurus fulvidraco]XP_027033574.2 acyl-CoA-binding domain-containing protein 4 isoform X1 [Tachysurus fulvidraco]XP_027033575.2 acyl-CoA-binding domain-containing protein 4 isoform X1 [Tachysurus fulvidraco]
MEIQVAHLPSESEECQKRFQASVDVIQNLPKNGSYRPSYEVMLRFYSLYKQAVCGPCTVSRPGFWDPVGRYKWDAWNRLGDMSRETAMAAYVDEMKKVAQEVVDNMPINEKTASFYHYFEPLYNVIHDLPRPPEALLSLRQDINAKEATEKPLMVGAIQEEITQEQNQKVDLEPVLNIVPPSESADLALSDGLVLTSDSESELFCDSVEQLDYIKPVPKPYSEQNLHVNYTPALQVTQLGAGQGGEGGGNGPPPRRWEQGRNGMRHGWREAPGSVPYSSGRRAGQQASGEGGGGYNPDRGSERLHDTQVQEQIILALQRLREDMQSVMERLEVVEGLAVANAQNSQWRQMQLTSQTEVEKWWPFDVSGQTLLLLLIWPFIAQGMIFWIRQRKK